MTLAASLPVLHPPRRERKMRRRSSYMKKMDKVRVAKGIVESKDPKGGVT